MQLKNFVVDTYNLLIATCKTRSFKYVISFSTKKKNNNKTKQKQKQNKTKKLGEVFLRHQSSVA